MSQALEAKIEENFSKYFLETKANNNAKMYLFNATELHKTVRPVKSKPKALQNF